MCLWRKETNLKTCYVILTFLSSELYFEMKETFTLLKLHNIFLQLRDDIAFINLVFHLKNLIAYWKNKEGKIQDLS